VLAPEEGRLLGCTPTSGEAREAAGRADLAGLLVVLAGVDGEALEHDLLADGGGDDEWVRGQDDEGEPPVEGEADGKADGDQRQRLRHQREAVPHQPPHHRRIRRQPAGKPGGGEVSRRQPGAKQQETTCTR
jgi:hypothetical protein